MKKTNNHFKWLYIFLAPIIFSCNSPLTKEGSAESPPSEQPAISYDTNNPSSIVKAVEMACGSWDKLWEQKDVEFTYSYLYPQEGKEDISTERYVFDTEQSWGEYTKHEINVMPEKTGIVQQYYDGEKAFCKHDDRMMADSALVDFSHFLRKANYFWFTMMFKLSNSGTIHEYQGQEMVKGINYDKVLVTYDPAVTGKEQNDTYVLYVNPETKMVDQFLFSLPYLGVNEVVLKMEVEYEEINGLKLPTKRSIFRPQEGGGYADEPNLVQTSSGIKFDNGFTSETLAL